MGAFYVAQLLVGALNVALKAPVPIQLVHLLLSNLVWITLVLMGSEALAYQPAPAEEQPSLRTVSSPIAQK